METEVSPDILSYFKDRLKDVVIIQYFMVHISGNFTLFSALVPLILLLVLPFVIVLTFFISMLIIYVYKLRHQLFNTGLARYDKTFGSATFAVSSIRRVIAGLWYFSGRFFHGYEVKGLEKLPKTGPAYLVYFHGVFPLDVYYLIAKFWFEYQRAPVPIVDRFLYRLPGYGNMLQFVRATAGNIEGCVKMLKDENEIVILSPGGLREALFSDEYYNVLWGNRTGFAKIAIKANQPIYPMFTENIREPVRVVQFGKSWMLKLYNYTRLPFVLMYGYFPCKLRTHIGDPIYPKSCETPEQLADRVKLHLEELIANKQKVPGNILRAIFQRIPLIDRYIHRDLKIN